MYEFFSYYFWNTKLNNCPATIFILLSLMLIIFLPGSSVFMHHTKMSYSSNHITAGIRSGKYLGPNQFKWNPLFPLDVEVPFVEHQWVLQFHWGLDKKTWRKLRVRLGVFPVEVFQGYLSGAPEWTERELEGLKVPTGFEIITREELGEMVHGDTRRDKGEWKILYLAFENCLKSKCCKKKK